MALDFNRLKVGTVLGEGVRSYTIEKLTSENTYLRGHPDAQRGETNTGRGALRVIPTQVIADILNGIESGKIQLDSVIRRNEANQNLPNIFVQLGVDHDPFLLGYDSTIYKICEHYLSQPTDPVTVDDQICLPKPFLLLAGISGTGKTRFVREQAKKTAALYSLPEGGNYCLVPVRPDWHEPSDLLGYISRIGSDGPRYVVTDLLRFIVGAWKHTAETASAAGIVYKPFDTVCPYWLCLDEMNLAPVEQYFADYLSILETRTWENGDYSCDPLLKSAVIKQQLNEEGQIDLWKRLGIDDAESAGLVEFFTEYGIALPPNLIVAGTVNMDETTHGFSRKVIDRALTFDFGEFFPNDYGQYYEEDKLQSVRPLGFPRMSGVHHEGALASVTADRDGRSTIRFLNAVNGILRDTPFELAYRALNEALLSVVCFNPADEIQLQAVWDDFLMMKVLPRIEGDAEKLGYEGEDTGRLVELSVLLKSELAAIADGRPDLLRVNADGSAAQSSCRSLKKLAWMQKRLSVSCFTSFWP